MKRSVAWLAVALTGTALLAAALGPGRFRAAHREPAARTAARRAFLRGLAAHDSAHMESAFLSMLEALRLDPSYLPPLAYGWWEAWALPPGVPVELERVAGATRDTAAAACIRSRVSAMRDEPATTSAGGPCGRFVRAEFSSRAPGPDHLGLTRDLLRAYPESPELHIRYWQQLARARSWKLLQAEVRRSRGPPAPTGLLGAAALYEALAMRGVGHGRDASRVEAATIAHAPGWAPGVRARYLDALEGYAGRVRLARLDTTGLASVQGLSTNASLALFDALAQGDPLAQRFAATARAHYLLDTGALRASVAAADSGLAAATRGDSPAYTAELLLWRGRALVKLGQPKAAEPGLLRARALLAPEPWDYLKAQVEHNLFHLYEASGRDLEARRAGRAFVGMTAGAVLPTRMIALRDLALYHQQHGEAAVARPLFRAMVALIDTIGSLHYYAGEYFELVGDLDRAERYYRLGSVDGTEDQPRAYAGLVRVAQARGDLLAAERIAREHDRSGMKSFPEATPLLPAVMIAEGRLREAAAELREARATAAARGQSASWTTLSLSLAEVLAGSGHERAAAALADSAAQGAVAVSLPAVAAGARSVAALARLRVGIDPSRQLLRLASAAADPAGTPLERADRHRRLGEGLRARGRLEPALLAFARGADLVDSVAPTLSDGTGRAQFRERQLAITSGALAALLENPPRPEAPSRFAEWSARRKARGLLDAGAGPAGASPKVRLRQLASGLRPDEAVLDYVVLDDAVAVMVVTPAVERIVPLPATPAALAELVRALLRPLDARVGSSLDTARARYSIDAAARLYDALVRPVEPLIRGRTHLAIAADGPIHLIPFAALVAARERDGTAARYLLDEHVVTAVPSLARRIRPRPQPLPSGVLVLVDPGVQGAESEIQAVRSAFPGGPVHVLTGGEGTEGRLRALAPAAGVLHLAVHATANAAQPGYAWLLLPGETGDGHRLYAHELSDLRLRSRLVVLSGCETGAGTLLGGEGVLSLARSFLAAGADATVATTWPVGPAAAEIVAHLYAGIARGDDPATALRTAQLRLRRDPHRSPLDWAPFVFITDLPR